MKMTATVELEFESAGETTLNAMDAALIRGLEALKGSIELGASGRLYKMGHSKESCLVVSSSATQATQGGLTKLRKGLAKSSHAI